MVMRNLSGPLRKNYSLHLNTVLEEVAFHPMAPISSLLPIMPHPSLSSSYVLICNISTMLKMIPVKSAHPLVLSASIQSIHAPPVCLDSMLKMISLVEIAWLVAIVAKLKIPAQHVMQKIISSCPITRASAKLAISSSTRPNATVAHHSCKVAQNVQNLMLVRLALMVLILILIIFVSKMEVVRLS